MKRVRPRTPRHLQPGDLVGVVAPCGPVDTNHVNRGLEFLERTGFRVLVGIHVSERKGYLAGTDRQRCDDLNSMLTHPEVRGIVFARGGYGAMRILDSLDCRAIASDPKVLVGMSDVTALQLSLYTRCRLMTFSGPMIAGQVSTGLDPLSEQRLKQSLLEPIAGRNLVPESGTGILVLRHGRAAGALLGGCLSLITALLGTRHCPDFTESVLFLEEIHESLYRIDRMLVQLKLAGILDRVSGIILGHFIGPREVDQASRVERMVMNLTLDHPVPVISRYPHGHTLPNLTLPHGAHVTLATDPPSLIVA
ncbi:MAG: LD-carboxypeptidase [Desulfomonilaceae bacterium]|nr:LD-carboxypeptidase [Desulfomonilaceae bacterium]